MIIRGGTGTKRALEQFIFRNWGIMLAVLGTEQVVSIVSRYSDVLQTDVFSATAIGLLATVIGIFLVFRFNEAYQRWWEARILWGALVNESRSFAREAISLLHPDRVPALGSAADAVRCHKELVYRHLAYCNALRLSLRRQDSWTDLAPFLDPEELEALETQANKPTQLNFAQGRQLARVLGGDTSQQLLLLQLDSTLNRILQIQGGCERIKNTAFPDEVRFVSRALVWLGAIAVPIAFLSADGEVRPVEVLATIVIVLSFMVVEQLGAALKNPFENRDNDTPMTALCRTIEIDLRQQLGETDLPPPIEPVDGVLM
ncbi:MAG: bestrophin family ion channel [Myxococcales bacterium]|jgi:putative membrane protein